MATVTALAWRFRKWTRWSQRVVLATRKGVLYLQQCLLLQVLPAAYGRLGFQLLTEPLKTAAKRQLRRLDQVPLSAPSVALSVSWFAQPAWFRDPAAHCLDAGRLTALTIIGMPDHAPVGRTGPSIYAALAEASPDALPEFVAEFRSAIAAADEDFDTGHIDRVIGHWWGVACMRSDPLTAEERAAADQLALGDYGLNWSAAQVQIDRQIRNRFETVMISKERCLEVSVYVEDVRRLALVLGVVLATEIPVATVEVHGRCRNHANVSIGNLRLTIADTGSVTHAELTVQVPDLYAAHRRLQAVEPGAHLRMLDGRPTVALSFNSLGLFIIGE